MFKNIVFISIFTLLTVEILLIKISDRKIDFCCKSIISIWTTISIGAVWAFLMNCINIPITLSNMGIAYGGSLVLFLIYLIKGKAAHIQRFEFKIGNFISILILCIFFAYIFLKTFGLDLIIAYSGGDTAAHYSMAYEILSTHKLGRMYFAALYNSMIMEMFEPFLPINNMYKAFILADASLNLLNLLMFFTVALDFAKLRFTKIILGGVAVFYFMGWPYWSWIAGGFVYFGVGVTVYLYGVYILNHISQNLLPGNKNSNVMPLLLGHMILVIFCLTECYLMFTPIFMLTIVVFFFFAYKDRITKMVMIRFGVIGIFIVSIVILLIVMGYFRGDVAGIFSALRINGGIYKELYKDFIFLIPINVFICIQKFKDKKNMFLELALFIQFLVVIIAFVGNRLGMMSDYYYFKLYYLGWALQLLGVVKGIDYFWSRYKQVVYFCIFPIMIEAVLEFTGLDQIAVKSTYGSTMFPLITQSIDSLEYSYSRAEQVEYMLALCRWSNNKQGGGYSGC